MGHGFVGMGTALNVLTVVVGALLGMAVGHRLSERVRAVVTDALGLSTLLMAGLSCVSIADPALTAVAGSGAVLVVVGSMLVGSVTGAALGIERRLEALAGVVQQRTARLGSGPGHQSRDESAATDSAETDSQAADRRERFIEGWMTTTLLFCVGPLTILGSISDGLGHGIDQLALKSILDGFAAMAFAASFGVGVLLSGVSVLVIQGSLTLVGYFAGSVLTAAQVAALTVTGGVILVGVGLRLLRIREISVGDMLPAIVVAPLIVAGLAALHH